MLIHDKEKTHKKLVEKLKLRSVSYSSSYLKSLADSENPLDPVNRIHCLLKMFLNAHSGFCREEITELFESVFVCYKLAVRPSGKGRKNHKFGF